MLAYSATDRLTRVSSFAVSDGCVESFLSLATAEGASFHDALAELDASYAAALQSHGLSDSSAVFCRVFLSDVLNQQAALLGSALMARLRCSCALSVVEQKPLGTGPVSMLSYHLRQPANPVTKRLSPLSPGRWQNELVVEGRAYSLLLTANYTGGDTVDAYGQTKTTFAALDAVIDGHGMSLLDNGIRTWVYVRDLDNHYLDMVRARRECFSEHGLTHETRYLASTGILGMTFSPKRIVSVDSLSVGGLRPGQVIRMEAPSHMGPTIEYGVTFERGLRVRFGDRSHLYISGTASIDSRGEVLHEGNAERQTRRAVENVRALLAAQSATVGDLAYVIAYVRNAHDRRQVEKVLDEELGQRVPLVMTEAAVCRPSWLMELEGVAVIPDESPFPRFL
jgi:enamine deaminase RidA (YjgF/YER057c/UK114 family)